MLPLMEIPLCETPLDQETEPQIYPKDIDFCMSSK